MKDMILIGIGILTAYLGFWLNRSQREEQTRHNNIRIASEEAYLKGERKRMKANRVEFMKEIGQITKSRHPESTRHQRRVVASCYKSHVKSY